MSVISNYKHVTIATICNVCALSSIDGISVADCMTCVGVCSITINCPYSTQHYHFPLTIYHPDMMVIVSITIMSGASMCVWRMEVVN